MTNLDGLVKSPNLYFLRPELFDIPICKLLFLCILCFFAAVSNLDAHVKSPFYMDLGI